MQSKEFNRALTTPWNPTHDEYIAKLREEVAGIRQKKLRLKSEALLERFIGIFIKECWGIQGIRTYQRNDDVEDFA
jgi:hypothetical protein